MPMTAETRARVCRRMAEAEAWIATEVGKVFRELKGDVPSAEIEARFAEMFARLTGPTVPVPLAALPAPAPAPTVETPDAPVAEPAPPKAPDAAPVTPPPVAPSKPKPVARSKPDPVAPPAPVRAAPQKPAPAPRRVPAKAPATTGPLPTVGQMPLTAAEEAELLRADAAGQSAGEIATALGRSGTGFHFTVRRLRDRAAAQAAAAPSAPSMPAPPSPASPVTAPAETNGWTHTRDLRLAEILAGGHGVDAAVRELGVPLDAVIGRWNALCPDKTIAAQEKLLKRLRADCDRTED